MLVKIENVCGLTDFSIHASRYFSFFDRPTANVNKSSVLKHGYKIIKDVPKANDDRNIPDEKKKRQNKMETK